MRTIGSLIASLQKFLGIFVVFAADKLGEIRHDQREHTRLLLEIKCALEVPDEPPPSNEFMSELENLAAALEALGSASPTQPTA